MTTSLPRPLVLALTLVASLAFAGGASAGEHRLGVGAHFWRSVNGVVDDGFNSLDNDGFAWVASYQYIPQSLLKFEIDLEYYTDGFGGSTGNAVAPIGYVLVGSKLYGALGVGVTLSRGLADDVSDPFFAARVGYQLALLPGIRLDVNANYRAGAFKDLDQADADAVTLGAIVRFNL